MNRHAKTLVVATLLAVAGLQVGCDQNGAITEVESTPVVGKGGASTDLGDRLFADDDFLELWHLLHEADKRARLKYFAGANLKRDLAFAKAAERKKSLTASEKARISEIRGLSVAEFQKIRNLREAILDRFPELRELTADELVGLIGATSVGKSTAVGKVLDKCSNCYSAYYSCVSTAEFRHAVEVMSCIILVQSVFGGSVCYLTSLTKYLWTINTCNQNRQYCLSSNGCLNRAINDTA